MSSEETNIVSEDSWSKTPAQTTETPEMIVESVSTHLYIEGCNCQVCAHHRIDELTQRVTKLEQEQGGGGAFLGE